MSNGLREDELWKSLKREEEDEPDLGTALLLLLTLPAAVASDAFRAWILALFWAWWILPAFPSAPAIDAWTFFGMSLLWSVWRWGSVKATDAGDNLRKILDRSVGLLILLGLATVIRWLWLG